MSWRSQILSSLRSPGNAYAFRALQPGFPVALVGIAPEGKVVHPDVGPYVPRQRVRGAAMSGVGEAVAAVVFCLVGGFMNSTWENVWLPFSTWFTALNALLCVAVVGPSTLSAVYRQSSTIDFTLVCVFSFLWGSGTMCFSLGIQLLGAGPGTALVMSLLVVIGTLLPLIEDHADNAASPAALMTILGIIFAISGFVASAQSSRIKAKAMEAAEKRQQQRQQQRGQTAGSERKQGSFEASADDFEAPACPRKDVSSEAEASHTVANASDQGSVAIVGRRSGSLEGATRNVKHVGDEVLHPKDKGADAEASKQKDGENGRTSHVVAVAVCVAGAVMSSMLQFAFVYGDPLIAEAEDSLEVPGAAAPLVVWLLAFSFCGLWNILYACYLLSMNNTWGRYKWGGILSLCRVGMQVTVMSIFFVGHIHLYGVAQYLFGDLGTVVAWPLLMSSTVLCGQFWSIFMKEWVGVPRLAITVSNVSIWLLVMAVTIIAIAGAVL